MLLHGDEIGRHPARQQQRLLPGQRAQPGSTGALVETTADLVDFTAKLHALRTEHPVFRRRRFFHGQGRGADAPARRRLVRHRRRAHGRRGLGERPRPVAGACSSTVSAITESDPRGEHVVDDSFLLLFNAYDEAVDFVAARRGVRQARGSSSSTRPRTRCARRADHAARPRRRRDEATSVAGRSAGAAPPRGVSACPSCPPSTYRLQLHARLRLRRRSAALAPYLARPRACRTPTCRRCCRPAPGSTHGYDVVDHAGVNDELGGADGLRAAGRKRCTARVSVLVRRRRAQPRGAVPMPESLQPGAVAGAARRPDVARTPDGSTSTGRRGPAVLHARARPTRSALCSPTARSPSTGPGREPVLRYHDHVCPVRPGTEDLPLPSCSTPSTIGWPTGGSGTRS